MTIREAALDIADRGLRVIPLKPNSKLPMLKDWPAKASADPEVISRWFDRWPDANYGVVTGDGLAVLDIDTKGEKNGFEQLGEIPPDSIQVATPTGGLHVYFTSDEPVRNRTNAVDGVDIRGENGFVVGPGSKVPAGEYRIRVDGPIAAAPSWFTRLAGRPIEKRQAAVPDVARFDDSPSAIYMATSYLKSSAPEAIEGAGGDSTTFQVAARLREFGVSEPMALELMLEHWNDRCSPPWDTSDLETKVANAYRYAENEPHSMDPVLDFADDPIVLEPPEPPEGLNIKWWDEIDFSEIPPQKFVLGQILARGKVTAVVGQGGAGKSIFSMGVAVSVATGRDFLGMPVHEQGRVLMINGEDDTNMMSNRLGAWVIGCGVDRKPLVKQLGMLAFEGTSFKLVARAEDNSLRKTKAFRWLEHFIKTAGITTLIVDPWVEATDADENNNSEVAKVAGLIRQLAFTTNCAALIVHHVRKGAIDPGDMDAARGASALSGVCRMMGTLVRMSENEAETFGIAPENRVRYVRFDEAKNNLAPRVIEPIWFENVRVDLPNGSMEPYLKVVDIKPAEVDEASVVLDELAEYLPLSLPDAVALLNESGVFAGTGTGKVRAMLKRLFAKEGGAIRIERDGKTDYLKLANVEAFRQQISKPNSQR